MDAEARERFERIEQNMLEFSEGMKELNKKVDRLAAAQIRTEETLNTLLDALLTGRKNGHGTQPPLG